MAVGAIEAAIGIGWKDLIKLILILMIPKAVNQVTSALAPQQQMPDISTSLIQIMPFMMFMMMFNMMMGMMMMPMRMYGGGY